MHQVFTVNSLLLDVRLVRVSAPPIDLRISSVIPHSCSNSTHHDTPEVWIRPRTFAEDLDRLVVGETEHPILARKVLQHRLTHANQDWGEPAVFIVFDKCVARGAGFSAIEVAFDF